jgi:hypothetical protein
LADHHTAYLQRAVASLTPEGTARVDELLAQLAQSARTHAWLLQFATARRDEADAHHTTRLEVEPADMLSEEERNELIRSFMVIRDTETLDDVGDWANAVLALLTDAEEGLF